ncbi:hypothetical protein BGZ76_011901 [Entomortierella beljakovae]|nr:hypothetical protein BGZ76_011901 [Entomortierella beljakovae]
MPHDQGGDRDSYFSLRFILEIGSSFGHLFQDVKAKKVYVIDVDQAFARSVFVSVPDKKLFLDFTNLFIYFACNVDTANHADKASLGRKEPDLVMNLKDDPNITICNIRIGEVTSMAQRGYKKKNAKGLVRIGGMLRNILDQPQDDFGISDAVRKWLSMLCSGVGVLLDDLYQGSENPR